MVCLAKRARARAFKHIYQNMFDKVVRVWAYKLKKT